MKSLMKWAVSFFVVGLIVLVGFNQPSMLRASASDDITIYMQSEVLTDDTIDDLSSSSVSNQLEPGDVQVSFCIRNNPGFCNSGMGLYYDSNYYEPITKPNQDDEPLSMKGIAGESLTIASGINSEAGIVGFASNGYEWSVDDGEIFSVFFRPIASNAPETPVTEFFIDMLSRNQSEHFDVTRELYVHVLQYYIIGDVDNNDSIDMNDANLISVALQQAGMTINAGNYQDFFDDIPEFVVYDVDGDGVVTDEDVACITSYYIYVEIFGSDPIDCGNAGTKILHVKYVPI